MKKDGEIKETTVWSKQLNRIQEAGDKSVPHIDQKTGSVVPFPAYKKDFLETIRNMLTIISESEAEVFPLYDKRLQIEWESDFGYLEFEVSEEDPQTFKAFMELNKEENK